LPDSASNAESNSSHRATPTTTPTVRSRKKSEFRAFVFSWHSTAFADYPPFPRPSIAYNPPASRCVMKRLLPAIIVFLSGAAVPAQEPTASCPDMARALQDLIRADTRARDFAELNRFKDDNRAIKPGDSRVVFMGDSITDLWRQPQFGGFFPGKPYVD